MRVLVVEDEIMMAEAIAEGLRDETFAVDVAVDGQAALDRLGVNDYDVVVLDRDLPGVHGDEVCRSLVAEHSDTRVLMLTAASTIRDRVEGLGLGADDYLPKPFDFDEHAKADERVLAEQGAQRRDFGGVAAVERRERGERGRSVGGHTGGDILGG